MPKFLITLFCILLFSTSYSQEAELDPMETLDANEQFIGQFAQLAPMAVNPYVTVFITSFCSKMDLHNDYVKTNPFFNNWFVLGLFGLLFGYTAIVGSIWKVGPLSPMGIADNWLSGKAALVIQGIVVITPTVLSSTPELETTVVEAGLVTMSLKTILILTVSLYYLIVVMTVNFFIDILVFLSPIPLVDLILNILKIVFASVLVIVSIISPLASVIIAGCIFIFSLLLYRRAKRMVNKTKYLMVYPVLNMFRNKEKVLTNGQDLSILVLTKKALGKIKKGRIVRLEKKEGEFMLTQSRFLLADRIQKLELRNCHLSQTHLDIYLFDDLGDVSLILNRSYHKCIDELAEQLKVDIVKRASFNLNVKKGFLGKMKGLFNKSDIKELKSV